MPLNALISPGTLDRRAWFRVTAAGLAGLAVPSVAGDPGKKTEFQIACMTLPYARFPLERALTGAPLKATIAPFPPPPAPFGTQPGVKTTPR